MGLNRHFFKNNLEIANKHEKMLNITSQQRRGKELLDMDVEFQICKVKNSRDLLQTT
jgi:hypothetical protein